MNFKENLKKLRKEKNISQEQLAEKLNISRQAISKWESGKAYPDIDNLILLRDIFNVSLDELMVNEKTDKGKSINQEEDVSSDNKDSYDEEDEDEDSVNLMLGGFIIGTGVGVITGNFMWGTAGTFIGMGIGYVLEVIRRKNKEKR
ncbi:transcriptional regulator [Clostridium sulfidigenes]|uniref:Transcriptional regulator n=1 Tax=Clostridium sulfidigenes TaxID=318464 RepID=A0A084J9J4_9CLOT|nr:transcriptional regulator [Clostridium sulfidigenes]